MKSQTSNHGQLPEDIANDLAYVIQEAYRRVRAEERAEENQHYDILTLIANPALATWS